MADTDSGVVSVNMDDAILSGKVLFDNRESILLLTPTHIICREFAGHRDTFVLALDRLLHVNEDVSERRAFVIVGTFPHHQNPAIPVQHSLRIVCDNAQETHEWIDTIQAVQTDRNIRSVNAQEARGARHVAYQERASQEEALNKGLAELHDMFPGIGDDVLTKVLKQHKMNVEACVEPLLAIADPNYVAPAAPDGVPTPESAERLAQIQQDELYARMLEDQIFHEELQRSGALQSWPGGPISYQPPIAPVVAIPQQRGGARPAPASRPTGSADGAAGAAAGQSADDGLLLEESDSTADATSATRNFVESIKNMSDAAKRKMTLTYRKFLTMRQQNRSNEELGQEMMALHLDEDDHDASEVDDRGDADPQAALGAAPEEVKQWLAEDEDEDEDEDDSAERLVSRRGKGLASDARPTASSPATAAAASAPAPALTAATSEAQSPPAAAEHVPVGNLIDL